MATWVCSTLERSRFRLHWDSTRVQFHVSRESSSYFSRFSCEQKNLYFFSTYFNLRDHIFLNFTAQRQSSCSLMGRSLRSKNVSMIAFLYVKIKIEKTNAHESINNAPVVHVTYSIIFN